jgi:hypothetical protein
MQYRLIKNIAVEEKNKRNANTDGSVNKLVMVFAELRNLLHILLRN